jgi:hypothetical protein
MARGPFDGTSQYLQTTTKLDLSAYHTVAFGLRVKATTWTNNNAKYLLQFYDGSTLIGAVVLSPENSTNTHAFDLTNITNGTSGGSDEVNFPRPSTGASHYFIIQLSNTTTGNQGVIAVDIDGVPQTLTGITNRFGTNTFGNNFLTIGAAIVGPGTAVGGWLALDALHQIAVWGAAAGSTSRLLSTSDTLAASNGCPTDASIQPIYYNPVRGKVNPEPALIGTATITASGSTVPGFVAGPSNLATGTLSASSITGSGATITASPTGGEAPAPPAPGPTSPPRARPPPSTSPAWRPPRPTGSGGWPATRPRTPRTRTPSPPPPTWRSPPAR